MKISISGFDSTIAIPDDGGIATIVIQDDLLLRKIIEDLLDEYTKKAANNHIVISDGDDLLNLSKDTLLVTDVYSYDLSSRAITTALYKDIQENSDIDMSKLAQIEASILDLLHTINTGFSQNLDYNAEISMNDIMKMAHVTLEVNSSNNYLDKLYGIIDSAQQLLSRRLIILVNQRQLLSYSELRALLQYVQDNHFSVLFIEKNCNEKIEGESSLTIDSDLYDFSVNSQ